MSDLKDVIWQALRTVQYPGYDRDIVSFGLVRRVSECEGAVTVVLELGAAVPEAREQLAAMVQHALCALPGLRSVEVQVARPPEAPQSPGQGEAPERLPGVRLVVAVGSGKGGVGKSTVAVNLAVALARRGLRVGLMDADAYGPNVPRMLGVSELPPARTGLISPAEALDVRAMSIGLMVARETPLVWRGPMTDKMVRQFLTDVAWGELDVLLVDLPPSTGDIPVSLASRVKVDGAVVVVSPQAVAADDALKAIGMFRKLGVPLLGIVENMSYFECGHCRARHYIFGRDGGRELAKRSGVPFLGDVPMEPVVREGGDSGHPAVLLEGSSAGLALRDIADQLWRCLDRSPSAAMSGEDGSGG